MVTDVIFVSDRATISGVLKKLFSSVFIVLILLNVMGYYGIFVGLQYSNTREMIRQFDADTYNKDAAKTLKIPFTSAHSSETFKRIDGDFECHGETYRLIKQRLYRDTFHIVYIKDRTATLLNKVIEDYVKTFSENSSDEDQLTLLPVFIKEYFTPHFSIKNVSPGYQHAVCKQPHQHIFIHSFISGIVHPPERV